MVAMGELEPFIRHVRSKKSSTSDRPGCLLRNAYTIRDRAQLHQPPLLHQPVGQQRGEKPNPEEG
jgi:hypothetical protein